MHVIGWLDFKQWVILEGVKWYLRWFYGEGIRRNRLHLDTRDEGELFQVLEKLDLNLVQVLLVVVVNHVAGSYVQLEVRTKILVVVVVGKN